MISQFIATRARVTVLSYNGALRLPQICSDFTIISSISEIPWDSGCKIQDYKKVWVVLEGANPLRFLPTRGPACQILRLTIWRNIKRPARNLKQRSTSRTLVGFSQNATIPSVQLSTGIGPRFKYRLIHLRDTWRHLCSKRICIG